MLFLPCVLLDDLEAGLAFPGRTGFSSLKRLGHLDFNETVLGVGEHSDCLFQSDAGKPFEKLVYRSAGFKVFKQGSHGHASATKNPGAAEFVFASFYLLTITPIEHSQHDMLPFRHG